MNTIMDALPMLSRLGEKPATEAAKPKTEVNGEGFEGATKTGEKP